MSVNDSSVSVGALDQYCECWSLEKVGRGIERRWMLRYMRGGVWWVLEAPKTWARGDVLEFAADYLRVVVED